MLVHFTPHTSFHPGLKTVGIVASEIEVINDCTTHVQIVLKSGNAVCVNDAYNVVVAKVNSVLNREVKGEKVLLKRAT